MYPRFPAPLIRFFKAILLQKADLSSSGEDARMIVHVPSISTSWVIERSIESKTPSTVGFFALIALTNEPRISSDGEAITFCPLVA